MPGNAGYTMLMFRIVKEWHYLLTYPVVIVTVGAPRT